MVVWWTDLMLRSTVHLLAAALVFPCVGGIAMVNLIRTDLHHAAFGVLAAALAFPCVGGATATNTYKSVLLRPNKTNDDKTSCQLLQHGINDGHMTTQNRQEKDCTYGLQVRCTNRDNRLMLVSRRTKGPDGMCGWLMLKRDAFFYYSNCSCEDEDHCKSGKLFSLHGLGLVGRNFYVSGGR